MQKKLQWYVVNIPAVSTQCVNLILLEHMDPPIVIKVPGKFGHLYCKVAYLNPRLQFVWHLGKKILIGETSQTLIAAKKGKYSCRVSNDDGVASSLKVSFREYIFCCLIILADSSGRPVSNTNSSRKTLDSMQRAASV